MGQTLSMLDVQGTRFEVQPANGLERNGLQHEARAGRYYSLSEREKKIFKALGDDYVDPSGIEIEELLRELIYYFDETRSRPPRRYVRESSLLVKEVCTFMADLFLSYMTNNQNSDQEHEQSERGYMTVREYRRMLKRIYSEAFEQTVEEADEEEADEEDTDEEDTDEEDTDEEDTDEEDTDEEGADGREADPVIEQGEAFIIPLFLFSL